MANTLSMPPLAIDTPRQNNRRNPVHVVPSTALKTQMKRVGRFLLLWVGLMAGCFITYPLWYHAFRCLLPDQTNSDIHTALTAIFTLYAFVGVIVTLHFQRRDLEAQAQEIAAQRKDSKTQNAKGDVFQLLDAW